MNEVVTRCSLFTSIIFVHPGLKHSYEIRTATLAWEMLVEQLGSVRVDGHAAVFGCLSQAVSEFPVQIERHIHLSTSLGKDAGWPLLVHAGDRVGAVGPANRYHCIPPNACSRPEASGWLRRRGGGASSPSGNAFAAPAPGRVSSPSAGERLLARLRDARLVGMRSAGTTHYYRLDTTGLARLRAGLRTPERIASLAVDAAGVGADAAETKVLANFLVGERLKEIPASLKKRQVILRWLATDFESGRDDPEKEVNEIIGRRHPDFARPRRELIVSGLITSSTRHAYGIGSLPARPGRRPRSAESAALRVLRRPGRRGRADGCGDGPGARALEHPDGLADGRSDSAP